jgi:hypothetical protein
MTKGERLAFIEGMGLAFFISALGMLAIFALNGVVP